MTCDSRFIVGARFRSPPMGVSAEEGRGASAAETATPGAATTERAFQTEGGLCPGVTRFRVASSSGETHVFFQYPTRPQDGMFLVVSLSTSFTSVMCGRRAEPSETSGIWRRAATEISVIMGACFLASGCGPETKPTASGEGATMTGEDEGTCVVRHRFFPANCKGGDASHQLPFFLLPFL